MSHKIDKYCTKCETIAKHRLVKDNRTNRQNWYYSCVICAENSCKKHRLNNWYKYLAQKANARKRPNSIKLVEEDILYLAFRQDYKCALTNQDLNIVSKWWKPSLDRIDSNLGYTKNNIRLVAWIVNHTKGKLTDEEFISMCNKVTTGAKVAKKAAKKGMPFGKKDDKKDPKKDDKKKPPKGKKK